MANRIIIKRSEDHAVHFNHRRDYTLCGLETMGDPQIGIQTGETTKRKVNCRTCIEIVDFCKQIRLREYVPGVN